MAEDSLSHSVLQHWAFAGTLSSYHGNLREVDRAGHSETCERILETVDDGDQVLHALIVRHLAAFSPSDNIV